ncbi:dihydropteroate synthase [Thalassotalea ponticola]|uniref:dihydropteroate synthase n=1 Tax=Thalassotalea ponticola TaxID=1523392 RepID=UPI0025B5C2E9|nr:dihydropteroate synthase [Thalassotalea ponticola]MDN3651173.1 dihydropteroate synthase [Thalassotalea ponticola]
MRFASKVLDLSQPQVMGILNVTPDSFSDGGNFNRLDNALRQAEKMIADGASIIDVGGESTRPGAAEVQMQQELDRVIPVITAISQRFDTVISIDTSKAMVMQEAIVAGAGMINDVRALQNEGCLDVAASCDVPICLMHMQGMPRTMQDNPVYHDIIGDINQFFKQRIDACNKAGIDRKRLILDPGYGFGKTLEQNYQLLARQAELLSLGLPILSGMSRKSMIGNLLNCDVEQRLAGSLSAAVIAAIHGASIIRVHDVKQTVDALAVLEYTTKWTQAGA